MEHEAKKLTSGKSNNPTAKAKVETDLQGVSFATLFPRHSAARAFMSEHASTSRSRFGLLKDTTTSTQALFVKNLHELTSYFLGFWNASHAATALGHLGKLEIKRQLRALQEKHGSWQPPEDVAEALKKPPKLARPFLLDNKDSRNLKFVLKILGCSTHENKPYRQFLKAKTLGQKRNWLYKYHKPKLPQKSSYSEPICPTRLKRLYQFFPNNFTEENGSIYFNNKMLTYDVTKDIYYIGKELKEE